MKAYSKPKISTVTLKNDQSIANECWQYNNHTEPSPTWYHDENGTTHGYVHFYIKQTAGGTHGCNLSGLHVFWHDSRQDTVFDEIFAGDKSYNDRGEGPWDAYTETYNWLHNLAAEQAQNFKGEGLLPISDDDMS